LGKLREALRSFEVLAVKAEDGATSHKGVDRDLGFLDQRIDDEAARADADGPAAPRGATDHNEEPGSGPAVGAEPGERARGPTRKLTFSVRTKEILTELRHKYLTILKSKYWELFEEGMCRAGAVTALTESADRSLDYEDEPLTDWAYISAYALSPTYVKVLTTLAGVPCVGGMAKR